MGKNDSLRTHLDYLREDIKELKDAIVSLNDRSEKRHQLEDERCRKICDVNQTLFGKAFKKINIHDTHLKGIWGSLAFLVSATGAILFLVFKWIWDLRRLV